MTSRPVITLTTDFGLSDAYVASLHAVVASRLPDARIVDITHLIPPQGVTRAAFVLESAAPYFPPKTVHLVVVDPGVGSERVRLVIAAGGQYFIGPDNGCLSAALPASLRGMREPESGYAPRVVALSPDVAGVRIENFSAIFVESVSATFEGRDVFAPAAAFLAGGGHFSDLGPHAGYVTALPTFRAPVRKNGEIDGLIIHIDHFGNLITDIEAGDLPPAPVFEIAGTEIHGLAHTYASAGSAGPSAIIGSTRRVEIAVPGRNAAIVMGAGIGDGVRVRS